MAPLTCEAVLWDAMLSAGWTPTQCRMAFAAAARGTVVEDRIPLTPWDIERLSRPESAGTLRHALLQQIGVEAANLACVRVTLAADHLSGILEARLLVAPGPTG